ncbi:hypothetical protein HMPREF1553_02166 [Porphyromonas gingivalis F0568]|nr:hypothetical protein HMPREF1553_02166 [Porphyromonas gingivalis F0568]
MRTEETASKLPLGHICSTYSDSCIIETFSFFKGLNMPSE